MNKIEIHKGICDKSHDTYKAKNADYGDSFAKLRRKYPNAILIRLTDKLSRLETLMNGGQQQVNDESIDDTLLDIGTYAFMELTEREMDRINKLAMECSDNAKHATAIFEALKNYSDSDTSQDEEYKPEPVLTQREKHFVEFVQDGYIARDGDDGFIHWFEEKPRKGTEHWIRCGVCTRLSSYSNNLFPFITWEDEESWAVEDLRKLKVADEG